MGCPLLVCERSYIQSHCVFLGCDREALVPIHADADGHCLVHAVSRALVGRELFWHPLRTHLKRHIYENKHKYKVYRVVDRVAVYFALQTASVVRI